MNGQIADLTRAARLRTHTLCAASRLPLLLRRSHTHYVMQVTSARCTLALSQLLQLASAPLHSYAHTRIASNRLCRCHALMRPVQLAASRWRLQSASTDRCHCRRAARVNESESESYEFMLQGHARTIALRRPSYCYTR